jgi:serine/threonine-protein kinase
MYGPGARLANRYRLDERVGGGGMGEVWRATDLVLDRTVAVKVMRPELLEEPSFAERFLAEARTMATIRHPGVVGVHDYRSDSTGAFLVMEYVSGEALSRRLHRLGRLDPTLTMTLMAQAADALQAAHDRGVVHRDIKPGNLLVTPDHRLVLTDFGIARSAASTPLTATGAVIGTPSYLAPEQVLGRPATARSDLYALGVVGYECLAGRRPFDGENPFDVAMKRLRDPPPPLADTPPEVRAVVERALAPDPDQRWPSAADLAAAARRAAAPGAPDQPGHPADQAGHPADQAGHPADQTTAPAPDLPATAPARPAPRFPAPDPRAAGGTAPDPRAAGGTAPDPRAPGGRVAGPPAFQSGRVAVPEPAGPVRPTLLESGPLTSPPPGPPVSPPAPAPRSTQQPLQPPPSQVWPALPARPPTVLIANLLLKVAALSLIVYCIASISALEVLVAETSRTAGPDGEAAAALVAAVGWAVVGGLLLMALLLLLLAWRNNQRSRGARGWTYVIGLSLLCCCIPVGFLGDAGGTVDADRSDFERRLAAAMPPWYEPVTSATGLILGTALLAALVLLVLPPANRFFRLPPPAVVYYPYYPHYPYPPRT